MLKRHFTFIQQSAMRCSCRSLVLWQISLVSLTCMVYGEISAETRTSRRLSIYQMTLDMVGQNEFYVPPGVYQLSVTLVGANGGDAFNYIYEETAYGGMGAMITATISVNPGELLIVNAGGQGAEQGLGGANGGGASCLSSTLSGGSGGGATDIRRAPYQLEDRLVVAGGGGGGYSEFLANGGSGGHPFGEDGDIGNGAFIGGGGGGPNLGGNPGGSQCQPGQQGSGSDCCDEFGAGGGGGYYGGGGAFKAAGGGGSSFAVSGLETAGIAEYRGSGWARLTWEEPEVAPTEAPSAPPTDAPWEYPSYPTEAPWWESPTYPTEAPWWESPTYPTEAPWWESPTYPTEPPSAPPTDAPWEYPYQAPPTDAPSAPPTDAPWEYPTVFSYAYETDAPTDAPTRAPSATRIPTSLAPISPAPTLTPSSANPSGSPATQVPTMVPTVTSTLNPTANPTNNPTLDPTAVPTRKPTPLPTLTPTVTPTAMPTAQPTSRPSSSPSAQPTSSPTAQPTRQPSSQPTRQPSSQPSGQPRSSPSSQPSSQPSSHPTAQPSGQPSVSPTRQPSSVPSSQPSRQPTSQPSSQPSATPTTQPSSQPSGSPSAQPSRQPSSRPTTQPSKQPSSQPSRQPTNKPTGQPSSLPSAQPSRQPSSRPSAQPSTQPSVTPTGQPSVAPTAQPSAGPTSQPSRQPTTRPSGQPSGQPSSAPSRQPSSQPSVFPSGQPTVTPTNQPSAGPSAQPTAQPSRQPSSQPSRQPSSAPSSQPTSQPSRQPTGQPSVSPTGQPSVGPTSQPSVQPTRQPSSKPSGQPTSGPTSQPSGQPTRKPSGQPSSSPSAQPSGGPTGQPSAHPSGQPSSSPTAQPSRVPTGQPSGEPSRQPSGQPSSAPSSQPTSHPSGQPTTRPSAQPSGSPSSQPSVSPTGQPSAGPTSRPSGQPSTTPTSQPSTGPTGQPSERPSAQPSGSPSSQPTASPSGQPSSSPTSQPTRQPSVTPSAQPSGHPSSQPSVAPSTQPSGRPTSQPVIAPSAQPSVVPTCKPSAQPTSQPSVQPSSVPSVQPSGVPSAQPSGIPSSQPSTQPSSVPTSVPSTQPSSLPSAQPSGRPSAVPSVQPSSVPSSCPTSQPSSVPSSQPSSSPTGEPTSQPSAEPSTQPSAVPTSVPSSQPSSVPSVSPTADPTSQPSAQPTSEPTGQPTSQPSAWPSAQPSAEPSRQPSSAPTTTPSSQPSSEPSVRPSSQPSVVPSGQPSAHPSTQPTSQPVAHPTGQPTSQPSRQPSRQPSSHPSSQPSRQPSGHPTSEPTAYETSRFIYSRSPSVVPTRSPTLTERASWVEDLQSVLIDVVVNDTSAVAHRSTYYELDVTSASPFHTYGGCSAWSTVVSADIKPSTYMYKVSSVSIRAVVDVNSDEFAESVVSGTAECADASIARSIVIALAGSTVTTSRTFQCGAAVWTVRHCQVGTTATYAPAVCVNCADPCSAVKQCVDTSVPAPQAVLAVSPCVQQQCTGQYAPATAIRILSVGYANVEVAPSLVSVSAMSTKTSIQVTARLSSSGSVAAAIYRASASVSAPVSLSAVALQNVAGSANAANSTTLTFQGLDAATLYNVYILATSPIGVKSTLVDVIGSLRSVTTECCKTVTGTLTATSAIEQQSLSNVLSIALSSAPSASLGLAIQLYSVDVSAGTTTLYTQSLFPASFAVSSIASTATTLRASLPALPTGVYEYRVVLSGDSASEFSAVYANSQQRIEVISAVTEPPVPVLSQAVFASDGSYVSIAFSANTNKGGTATSFACSALFDFTCAATSKCQWVDAATVRAYIQGASTADSCVRPGSTLALSTSAQIKAKCQAAGGCPTQDTWATVPAAQVSIGAPSSAISLTVAISAPSVIGGCDSLSLDVSGSSGSGGRSWKNCSVSVLTTQSVDARALSTYLNDLVVLTPPPAIPAALLIKGAQYNFAVTLCNFLGTCNVGYKQVLVLNDTIPIVSLPGSALRTISRKSPLSLASSAFVATCDGKKSSAGLVYKWTISSSNVQLLSAASTSKDASKFLLPAYNLSAGAFYQVTLSVNAAGSTQSSSASVQVFVQPGSLVAVIQGGSARTMRVANTLRLDASSSLDEDVSGATGLAAGLHFAWSCVQVAPVFSDSCVDVFDGVKLSEVGSEVFDLLPLATAAGANCEVTVTIIDGPRRRTSSATVTVSVLPELSPVVSVTTPSVPSTGVINAGQLLQLAGTISVPATYGGNATWTVSGPSINLAAIALFPVMTAIGALPTAASTAIASRAVYMAFAPNSLPSGATLTFSLVGTIPSLGKQAVGSVTVTINAPPTPGSFYVSPDSGVELNQAFQFVALNWVDSDLPLTYQFEYFASNGLSVVVRSKLELSYGSFLLPAGSAEANNKVPCAVQIFDALAANNTATYDVTVTADSARSVSEVQDFVSTSLADATSGDGIKQAAALSSYLLNSVNCTLAPNCSSLHRKSCLSTAHTCGVCESLLYVGVEGDSNEPCYSKAEYQRTRRLSIGVVKSCPADCSGHGTCTHVSADSGEVITSDMSPCLEGDARCLAVCDCEEAFFGSDSCEFSTEEVAQRQSSRELVVSGLQTLIGLEDPDEQVIGGWVNSLVQASQTPSELSDASALTVLSLVDTVTAAASSAASGSVSSETIAGLLSAVNSVAAAFTKAAIRRRLSHRRRRTTTASEESSTTETASATRDVLNSFGSLVAQSLLPGQEAAQFTQGEFRMSVQVLAGSSDEIAPALSLSVPQTALEQLLGVSPSQVAVPGGAAEDVSLVATSVRSEHFQSLGQDLMSNPLTLFVSAPLCAAPPCFVDVVLQNSQAVDFAALNANVTEVHNTTCSVNEFSEHNVTCQNGHTVSLGCTGVAGLVSQRCPVIKYAGACNTLISDSVVSGAASGCSVLSYSDTSVTCRCAFSSQTDGRRLQGHNFTAPAGYSANYASMLSATASSFASTILTADDLDASTVAKGWRSLATLGTLAGAIICALFWSNNADRQAKRVKPTEKKPLQAKETAVVKTAMSLKTPMGKKVRFGGRAKKAIVNAELQIVEDSLPRVLSSRTFSDRFLEEVKQHHRWFGIVFYFSDSFPRVLRVISLASNAIIMLFIQSITYNLTNPDDGSCAALHTETDCLVPKSPFATGEAKCAWLPPGPHQAIGSDGHCAYIEPDNSVRIILFVAIFCAIVTTPIALAVDWIVGNILSAPTQEVTPVPTEVVTSLVPGTPDANTTGPGLARKSSATSATLMQFLKVFNDEEKIAEDRVLLATSRAELLVLSAKLKSYRDRLRPDELEEFNLLWGLDAEGNFLTKAAEDPTLLGRLKAMFVKKEEVNVKEAVLMDLKNINAAVRKESAALRESHAPKYEIGKKLLFLFQCDLLPGISGKILELKGSRDSSTVKHVSMEAKIMGYTFLFVMNVGMLFYIFLFALTQTGPRQNAWFQSFALWLVVEILLVSTAIVFFTHIMMPLLVMKDLTQIKRRLMDNIRDFNEKVKSDKGKQESEDSEAATFNAANYLFVSTRLARQFPDLKESKIISQFSTPWPRQSYLRVQNVSKGYSKKFSALTRSASIIVIFFVGNFLVVPPGIQDMLVQITSTTAIGYLVLIHVQLYEIFPVLVVLPALVLALLVHFVIQSSKSDAQIKLARLFPAKKKTAGKYDVSTELVARTRSQDTDSTVAVAVAVGHEESKSYNSDDSFAFSDSDLSDEEAKAVVPVAQHRTRRQSIQTGLQLLQAMEKAKPASSTGSLDLGSDSTSSSGHDESSHKHALLDDEAHDDGSVSGSSSDASDSDIEDSEVSDSEESDTESDVSVDIRAIQIECAAEDNNNELLHQASNTPQQSPYSVLHKSPSAGQIARALSVSEHLSVDSGDDGSDSDDSLSSFHEGDEANEVQFSDATVPPLLLSVAVKADSQVSGQSVRDFESLLSTARVDTNPPSAAPAPVPVARSLTCSSIALSSESDSDSVSDVSSESNDLFMSRVAPALSPAPPAPATAAVAPESYTPVNVISLHGSESSHDSADDWDSQDSQLDVVSTIAENDVPVPVPPVPVGAVCTTEVISTIVGAPNTTVCVEITDTSHDASEYDFPSYHSEQSHSQSQISSDSDSSAANVSRAVSPVLTLTAHFSFHPHSSSAVEVNHTPSSVVNHDPYAGYNSGDHSISEESSVHGSETVAPATSDPSTHNTTNNTNNNTTNNTNTNNRTTKQSTSARAPAPRTTNYMSNTKAKEATRSSTSAKASDTVSAVKGNFSVSARDPGSTKGAKK